MAIFPGGPGLENGKSLASTRMTPSWNLLELRMIMMSDTYTAAATATINRRPKAPVKSLPTNQHPIFYMPDALNVTQATMSEH